MKEIPVKMLGFGIACFLLAGTGGLIALPRIMEYAATPEFCGKCHVMEQEHESWFQSGSHARISCVDCHLPNNNPVSHYVWKALDGNKDVVLFFSGMVSERIDATPHARTTIQSNCIRCHEDMVIRISGRNMNCWQCHRSKFHFRNL